MYLEILEIKQRVQKIKSNRTIQRKKIKELINNWTAGSHYQNSLKDLENQYDRSTHNLAYWNTKLLAIKETLQKEFALEQARLIQQQAFTEDAIDELCFSIAKAYNKKRFLS